MRQLDDFVGGIDSSVEYQREKLLVVQADHQSHEAEITDMKQNITHLDILAQNNEIELANFENKINHKTNHIMKSEQQLKDKVKQVEKLTGNVTGKLETIDDTVQKNYVAFEVGLRHAATQAVDAKQKGILRILAYFSSDFFHENEVISYCRIVLKILKKSLNSEHRIVKVKLALLDYRNHSINYILFSI